MLLILLLLIPLIGIFMISTVSYGSKVEGYYLATLKQIKITGFSTSIINFFVFLVVFILFKYSYLTNLLFILMIRILFNSIIGIISFLLKSLYIIIYYLNEAVSYFSNYYF